METLDNGIICIAVKEHGAELASLKFNGREYLWQADGEFWARHSPVLFPIVGSVWNKEFRSGGKTFKMGQHGFARDMDFKLNSKTDNELWYSLSSSEDTLEKYPYEFILEIGYKLVGRNVEVMWKVTNPGTEDMYFQIGAHPAFHWPLLSTRAIAAGTAAMKTELGLGGPRGYFKYKLNNNNVQVAKSVIGSAGCVDPTLNSYDTLVDCHRDNDHKTSGYLPLTTDSFNNDALVYEDSQISAVTLCDDSKRPYLTLSFDTPLVGLWSPPGKNAPFVCIEPWYGRCDFMNYEGDYDSKPWMNHLAGGEVFHGGYTIIVEK